MSTGFLHPPNSVLPDPLAPVSAASPSCVPIPCRRRHEHDRGWTLEPAADATRGSRDLFGDALVRLSHAPAEAVPTASHNDLPALEFSTGNVLAEGAERRDYPRREASGAVSVAVLPTGETVTTANARQLLYEQGVAGELLDLSRNGLAFVGMQPLAGGVKLIVRLCLPQQDEHLDAVAEVVRTIPIAESLWKIVAQFEKPLSFEEAYLLCDHAVDDAG